MRALVLRHGKLQVEDVATPKPGEGQVLARVLACGICGSDLHTARFMDEMIAASKASGRTPWDTISPEKGLVMGHEFVAEIVEVGPGVDQWQPGQRVTSVPVLRDPAGPGGYYSIGYSPEIPGAYGEYILLSAAMLLPVADHLPNEIAATTEPCAVGLHAVNESRITPAESALVMGAGPIGLMTFLWLKHQGIEQVAVSDPSSHRRKLAEQLGAAVTIDPRSEDVIARFNESFGSGDPAAHQLQPSVVFECVGVPGTLQEALQTVRHRGRVVVAGVCMEQDRIIPMVGTNKHLTVQFVLGYSPTEYADALAALTDGSIDTAPMVTRTVSLEELPEAFEALADPRDCKIVYVADAG